MARKMTEKQKELVMNAVSDSNFKIYSWACLPIAVKKQLETINDYETLWSDVERLIGDLRFSR